MTFESVTGVCGYVHSSKVNLLEGINLWVLQVPNGVLHAATPVSSVACAQTQCGISYVEHRCLDAECNQCEEQKEVCLLMVAEAPEAAEAI